MRSGGAVQSELAREGKSVDEDDQSEDELRKEYHDIAERRVRLGLRARAVSASRTESRLRRMK